MDIIDEDIPTKYGRLVRLSRAELQFVFDVMNRIGGDPRYSRRNIAEGILYDLRSYKISGLDYSIEREDMSGAIGCARR